MTPESPRLRFVNASLGYGRRAVLRDVTFDIPRGAYLGVVGPNGSGKTTLLRAVLGILEPRAGRVDRGDGALRIGYVPQRFAVDPVFPVRVDELVAMGRYPHLGPLRRLGADDRRIVDRVCEQLGIADLKRSLFRDLSGGQQQRTLLARALATEPELLVLDEPTNGMDLVAEQGIVDLVRGLHRERGVTVLFVTHLIHLVADAATDLALVSDGAVVAGPRDELLDPAHLSAMFGAPIEVGTLSGRTVIRVSEAASEGAP